VYVCFYIPMALAGSPQSTLNVLRAKSIGQATRLSCGCTRGGGRSIHNRLIAKWLGTTLTALPWSCHPRRGEADRAQTQNRDVCPSYFPAQNSRF
jgi:hypothetical protein